MIILISKYIFIIISDFFMTKKEIITEKTGRYFILGTPSDKIKEIWFVCHGYGQLSNSFLKDFEIINNDENLFVAPEGLHRFY